MDTQRLRQELGKMRFFVGLSDEDQQQLVKISQFVEFAPGEEVFTEGTVATNLYLLLSGRVELCMNVPARGCLPILTLEEGDLLGWSAALDQGEMTATAVSIKPTQAIALSAEKLRELCQQQHDIGYEVMRRVALTLSRRLVATRLQVLDLFADSPPSVRSAELEAPQ